MKRPVTAALLGALVLATLLWRGQGAMPMVGAPAESRPELMLAGRATVLADLPDRGRILLRAMDGTLFAWQPGRLAEPLPVRTVMRRLPWGPEVGLETLTLSGRARLVGVVGVPAWIAPGGEAAVVENPQRGQLWALHADRLRFLPLGTAVPADRPAVVWAADGQRAAFLSGDPPRLWEWRVGSYAQPVGLAAGVPLAVRPDAGVVLAVAGRLALEWPRLGQALLLSMARPVAVAPDGGVALAAAGDRLMWVSGLNGAGVRLAAPVSRLVAAAYGPGDRLAFLLRAGPGSGAQLVLVSPQGQVHPFPLAKGYRLPATGAAMSWLGGRHLAVSLVGPAGYGTYDLSLPGPHGAFGG